LSQSYVLAIVGGAELFTSNNMMVLAWAHCRLSTLGLLRAWGIVFLGNFIGAGVLVAFVYWFVYLRATAGGKD